MSVTNMEFNYVLFFSIISLNSICFAFEIMSGGFTAAGIIAASAGYALKCKFLECCDDNWINFDEQKFDDEIRRKFFGQHLAEFAVSRILRGFYRNKNPKKALVMSFHGLTGSGKNYIANIISNCTYKEGTGSAYVHIYSGAKDFRHISKVDEYVDKLQSDITRFTRNCGHSLFIFDEIDKMAPGVLDSLKPYVDYYELIDGVDYRKNVFIFLSNAGSSSINNLLLKSWSDGKERESLTMKDMEKLINKGAFNEPGGLQYSELLRSSLVDAFIPFLPLERKHVRKCVEAELVKRGKPVDSHLVNQIADELIYFPPEIELYSASGCKRLEQKVDLYV